MICLGILVDTAASTLEVPTTRLDDLLAELTTWPAATFFTRKQLQSLLGKLSFVTACVKPGRIFMARLLNSVRECKRPGSHCYPISAAMLSDIEGWLDFLPRFPRVSLIKPSIWDFVNFNFSTDACLHWGGAVCHTKCISIVFPDYISPSTLHISALELLTVLVALKHWAPQLQRHKFIVPCDNSSILPLPRILSCSAVFDNSGSPPLFSISKCAHNMFLANTISLRTTFVIDIQTLQRVRVFIAYAGIPISHLFPRC